MCLVCVGIPVPEGLNATATNTSVTLQWKVPGETQLEDAYFNVRMTCIFVGG